MRSANFVEETTSSIAGTNGNGAVTLSAIANTPRFSTVFGTQATNIRYVIEDTVNKKFETGVGFVSGNVLTRTKPQVTWDGSAWNDKAPSPLAFGSTPTLGNIKIRLSATVESLTAQIPGFNRTLNASDNTWRDFHINNSIVWNGNSQGSNLDPNKIYYYCYRLENAGLLDGIAVQVYTGATSSPMKICLYDVGTNGLPNNKLITFNNVDTTTSGTKIDTATNTWSSGGPVWLNAGWYYIGFISDSNPVIGGNGSQQMLVSGPTPLGRANAYGWGMTATQPGDYATGLPANPAPTILHGAHLSQSVFWIGLRITP